MSSMRKYLFLVDSLNLEFSLSNISKQAERTVSITSDVFRVTSLQEDVPGSSDMADVVGSGSDNDRKE